MPYNGSGSFSIVNTFVPNTTILSAAVNANFTDIATGLSDVLTRDGQAGMTAAFKAISGTISAPGISFNSDASSGLYLPTTGEVSLVSKSLGLNVNSTILQVASATVQSGGSGYIVGETILIAGGAAVIPVTLVVATLSGSAVATVTVGYSGQYVTVPSNPASQTLSDGAGTGATFNLTFGASFSTSLVGNESGNLAWQRLGSSSFVSGLMAKVNAYDYINSLLTIGSGVALSNSTSPPTLSASINPNQLQNYLTGLTLSTAGGSGTFAIAAGEATDSTNVSVMLANALTKTTASFAAGSGNGGLDTGAIAGSTWYHVFLIQRLDTGARDILFSLSATSPTMPSGFTLFRRIGSMKTDGSNHWTAFTQNGDLFLWATTVADFNGAATASRVSQTLTVPTGVAVSALFRAGFSNVGTILETIFTALVETDQTPSAQLADIAGVVGSITSGRYEVLTNTSAQIGVRSSGATGTLAIATFGWKDTRGRLG